MRVRAGVRDASSLNADSSLADLGLDSLMGVEIRQILERDYDIVMAMRDIRQLTINKLREMVESRPAGACGGSSTRVKPQTSAGEAESGFTYRYFFFFFICFHPDSPPAAAKKSGVPALLDSDLKQLLVGPDGPTVVPLNRVEGPARPLFLVHPIEGSVAAFQTLAHKLQLPCFGLQCTRGVMAAQATPTSAFSSLQNRNSHTRC